MLCFDLAIKAVKRGGVNSRKIRKFEMSKLIVVISLLLNIIGFFFVAYGYQQLSAGLPGFYVSRNIAELQGDANELLYGIGLILCGIAGLLGGATAAVLSLVFTKKKKAGVSRTDRIGPFEIGAANAFPFGSNSAGTRPGRSVCVPEARSSKIRPHPAALSASSCRSGFWSRVETRAYPASMASPVRKRPAGPFYPNG